MELHGATVASGMKQVANPSKQFIADGVGFVELMECFGSDLTVVNAARVSFYKESSFEEGLVDGVPSPCLTDRDAKLIQFLAAHKHITPFFHPQLRFRIKMPIFVAREWWRSTIGFSRNEVSRRYVDNMPDFFIPDGLRQRDKNLKQGSKSEFIVNNEKMLAGMQDYIGKTQAYYQELLDLGVAPEQARMILPQSMYTEFIETASIAGYARLVGLRTDPTAQKEIRDYAHLVSRLVEPRFPVSWKALMVTKGL
jgi:thymidylate synthase (FAD)